MYHAQSYFIVRGEKERCAQDERIAVSQHTIHPIDTHDMRLAPKNQPMCTAIVFVDTTSHTMVIEPFTNIRILYCSEKRADLNPSALPEFVVFGNKIRSFWSLSRVCITHTVYWENEQEQRRNKNKKKITNNSNKMQKRVRERPYCAAQRTTRKYFHYYTHFISYLFMTVSLRSRTHSVSLCYMCYCMLYVVWYIHCGDTYTVRVFMCLSCLHRHCCISFPPAALFSPFTVFRLRLR